MRKRSLWGGLNHSFSVSDEDETSSITSGSSLSTTTTNRLQKNTNTFINSPVSPVTPSPTSPGRNISNFRTTSNSPQNNRPPSTYSNAKILLKHGTRSFQSTSQENDFHHNTSLSDRNTNSRVNSQNFATFSSLRNYESPLRPKSAIVKSNTNQFSNRIQFAPSELNPPTYIISKRKQLLGPKLAIVHDFLLVEILSYLQLSDLLNASLTCRKLFDLSSADEIWRRLFISKFYTTRVPAHNVKTAFLVRLEYAQTENSRFSQRSFDPISVLSDESHVLLVLKYELHLEEDEWKNFQEEEINGQDFLQLTAEELKNEFNLKYATRKRILNYIETVNILPEVYHYSIMEDESLDNQINMSAIQKFDDESAVLMKKVNQTLNEISSLLDTKGLLHLLPYTVSVSKLELQQCKKMLENKEIGSERRIVLSTRRPIDYFTDLNVVTRSTSKLNYKVLGILKDRGDSMLKLQPPITLSSQEDSLPIRRFRIHDSEEFLSKKSDDNIPSSFKSSVPIDRLSFPATTNVTITPRKSLQLAARVYSTPRKSLSIKMPSQDSVSKSANQNMTSPRKRHSMMASTSSTISHHSSNSRFKEELLINNIISPRKPDTPLQNRFTRLFHLQQELTLASPRNVRKPINTLAADENFESYFMEVMEDEKPINRTTSPSTSTPRSLARSASHLPARSPRTPPSFPKLGSTKAKQNSQSAQKSSFFPPIRKADLNANISQIDDLIKQAIS